MTSELDRLERRAQEVRGQLALDLDELFARLQPRRLITSAGDYARTRVAAYGREAQAEGELGRDIVRDMRRNPIPYLLVGIGIAGIVWAMTSFSRSRIRARLPEFSEADFAPPRAAAAHPVAPAGPTVTATSAPPTPATRPVSPATPAGTREISPATSPER
jgi:hypothetical protein